MQIPVPALDQLERISKFVVVEDEDLKRKINKFIAEFIEELRDVGYESSERMEEKAIEMKREIDLYLHEQNQEPKNKSRDEDEDNEDEIDDEVEELYTKKPVVDDEDDEDDELQDYVRGT